MDGTVTVANTGWQSFRINTQDKVSGELVDNINKLSQIAALQNNWNGNGAKRFSKFMIARMLMLLFQLDVQPEIFPRGTDDIQLEYDGDDDSYLEFGIDDSDSVEVFEVDKNGNEKNSKINFDEKSINSIVRGFYGK